MGRTAELAYPLPTTDQEVHQIRTLICEILAADAEDGKLLLQTPRPTTDHTGAPLQADRYTDTTHPARNPRPCLPPPPPPATHPAANTRPESRAALGPTTRASPTRPNNRTPLTTAHTRQPAHTHRKEPHAALHTHRAQ